MTSYTTQKNGVSERKNLTFLNMVLNMLTNVDYQKLSGLKHSIEVCIY
jgi:7,8-dihydro-6-hydroxymethylpterin-pyrophosphokinase